MKYKKKKPDVQIPVKKDPLFAAMNVTVPFGKHKGKKLGKVLEIDMFWIHSVFRKYRQSEYGKSPFDLAVELVCMHYPLGIKDDAEKSLYQKLEAYAEADDQENGPRENLPIVCWKDSLLRAQPEDEIKSINSGESHDTNRVESDRGSDQVSG